MVHSVELLLVNIMFWEQVSRVQSVKLLISKIMSWSRYSGCNVSNCLLATSCPEPGKQGATC